jgi:hypothetical protein
MGYYKNRIVEEDDRGWRYSDRSICASAARQDLEFRVLIAPVAVGTIIADRPPHRPVRKIRGQTGLELCQER